MNATLRRTATALAFGGSAFAAPVIVETPFASGMVMRIFVGSMLYGPPTRAPWVPWIDGAIVAAKVAPADGVTVGVKTIVLPPLSATWPATETPLVKSLTIREEWLTVVA